MSEKESGRSSTERSVTGTGTGTGQWSAAEHMWQHAHADHPGQALAALLQRLDGLRRAAERRAQLTRAELRLLWLLSDGRERTFREISSELGLEQSTSHRQVHSAADAGLITITSARPARHVKATDAGARAFNREVAQLLDGYEAALAHMEQAQDFTQQLGEFIDHYSAVINPDDAA